MWRSPGGSSSMLEARRAPRGERPQGAVGVDEPARATAAPRWRSGSRRCRSPTEAMPTKARPPAAPVASVDEAEVDRARVSGGDHARRRRRDPRGCRARGRGRCRGRPGSRRARLPAGSRRASASTPIRPSPLSTTIVSPRVAASRAELAGVVEVARVDRCGPQPVRAQRALGDRRQPGRLAASGGRVDDQADGCWHGGGLVSLAAVGSGRATWTPARAPWSRRRLPIAAAIASAAITTNRPSRMPGARPSPRTAARPARRCRGRRRAGR